MASGPTDAHLPRALVWWWCRLLLHLDLLLLLLLLGSMLLLLLRWRLRWLRLLRPTAARLPRKAPHIVLLLHAAAVYLRPRAPSPCRGESEREGA